MGALALTLVMAMSLVSCGGMSEGSRTDGIFYDATGISPDAVLMRVGGIDVTAESYFYQLYNMVSNVVMYCGVDGLGEDSGDGTSYADLSRDYTMESVREIALVQQWAEEYELTLSEEELAEITEEIDAYEESYGEFGFQYMGVTRETMEQLYRVFAYYDALEQSVYVEGGALEPTEEEMEQFSTIAGKADHILLTTTDLSTGEALSEEAVSAQYEKAQEILAQLRAAEDPVALFDELADQYSEDTGRIYYPDGYTYGPGGMSLVEEFTEAAKALAPGEISEIVETDYGYHILLRREVDDETLIADAGYFVWKLQQGAEAMEVEYSKLYEEQVAQLDLGAFYTSVSDARDALYTAYLEEQAAAAEDDAGEENEDSSEAEGAADGDAADGDGAVG